MRPERLGAGSLSVNDEFHRVVFDCNIYVQSLLSATGPSGACVQAALDRRVQLFLSPYILGEIRDTPNKPTPARLNVTPARVERLITNLLTTATFVPDVPHVFDHPIDPEDSHYVDLALASGSKLIVSRDRHLLGLNDPKKPWSADFRRRFPGLRVIPSEELLMLLRQMRSPG